MLCFVTGSEGGVACFLLPWTCQLLKSWGEAKGTSVCVFTFLREGAQRLFFFCYFVVTVSVLTLLLLFFVFQRHSLCDLCVFGV
ncbi:hypothetical protein TCDM_13090 [Trypanosoma cruzi Dm28c]|uniref:Uncharacterized protein n=1 Tax=Trypanosoma cruzi Dm28c TaxID=1416333 RepID=V5A3T2_TRYCR|nr:hypothetical protein TCDM_13090 [Trypanosoma cruzi Dm28c]